VSDDAAYHGSFFRPRPLLPDALEKHLDRKSTGRIVTSARRAVRSAVGKIGRAKGQSPFVLYHPSARRVYQPATLPNGGAHGPDEAVE